MIDLTHEDDEKNRQGINWYKKMPCSQRWYSTSIWLSEAERSPKSLKNHKAIEAHLIQVNLNGLEMEGCVGQRINHLDKKPPCGSYHMTDGRISGPEKKEIATVHQIVWSADGANLYLASTCENTRCVANAHKELLHRMQQYPMTVGPFTVTI